MPILKQSGSSHTKKRSRIGRDMISAPMGDFRHTMHVGRGGDVFGDTSFLSNHGPSPALPPEQPASKKNGVLGEPRSQFSQASAIPSGAGSLACSPANSGSSVEDGPGVWNQGSADSRAAQPDDVDWVSSGDDCGLKHAESMLSFHLDLGPSILDEVLGVMDKEETTSDWGPSKGDLYRFDYKLSSAPAAAEKAASPRATAVPLPRPQHGLVVPSGRAVRDSASSANSAYEGDSEEEKHSVYEGFGDSPIQHAPASHHTEEEEEGGGQGYTFDDSDDEIGL
ncbi:cdc42 effector protein 5 isoform X1 [Rhinatrema bivittatum]|nr:cdc42 effector protein 5 isoform X1 [Rhinatrema bivittatum]XP_029441102.1 cdc42 effector protein 5 isoform X1 [Rhinatrema bivittatum]XP_029441103.1 cdc42 effector protein 5 isoform X1 [Rhinatrema bivittatum]